MADREEHLHITREGDEWVVWLTSYDNWEQIVFGRFKKQPSEKAIAEMKVVINQTIRWYKSQVRNTVADLIDRIE